MERTTTTTLRAQIRTGILAGFAGGISIELFWLVLLVATGGSFKDFLGTFAFVAATVMGPAAYASPAAVPIGVLLHVAVSVGWALGYVYLLGSQPQLRSRPWISGAAYGLVVYVFMQLVLLTAGQYHRPADPQTLAAALIAHIVFYGIPVAVIASSLPRTPR